MRRTTPKEVEAVLRLDGPARFTHFIKRVVDEERAWGLWKDGWALMTNDDGALVFPLWPAREYADLCATSDWSGYEPSEIDLASLLGELAPKLEEKSILSGVFPVPSGRGVTVTIGELRQALHTEMRNYE